MERRRPSLSRALGSAPAVISAFRAERSGLVAARCRGSNLFSPDVPRCRIFLEGWPAPASRSRSGAASWIALIVGSQGLCQSRRRCDPDSQTGNQHVVSIAIHEFPPRAMVKVGESSLNGV